MIRMQCWESVSSSWASFWANVLYRSCCRGFNLFRFGWVWVPLLQGDDLSLPLFVSLWPPSSVWLDYTRGEYVMYFIRQIILPVFACFQECVKYLLCTCSGTRVNIYYCLPSCVIWTHWLIYFSCDFPIQYLRNESIDFNEFNVWSWWELYDIYLFLSLTSINCGSS